jgi:hypothetical protein
MIQVQPLAAVVVLAAILLLSSDLVHGRIYQTDDAVIVEGKGNFVT